MNEHSSWLVRKELVRTDYPVIENLKQFLVDEVPYIHPDHPAYVNFWSKEHKKCIEGVWGKEFGKWRYMPGNLYYFGNYTILEDTKIIDSVPVTKHFKPRIVDYFWEFAYMSWSCYGFSGFEKDEEVSCNRKLELYYKGELTQENLPATCIKPDGTPKLYEDAYLYLNKLHDRNLGRSLFENEAKDTSVMGTRCLIKDHNCITKEGYKPIHEVKVGDFIYNHKGELVEVKKTIHNLSDECYKITLRDKTSITCSADHVWYVWDKNKAQKGRNGYTEITAEQMYDLYLIGNNESRFAIPTAKPVPFDKKEHLIPCYTLGVLLGDGSITTNTIGFTTTDEDIAYNVLNELPDELTLNCKNSNTNTKVPNYSVILKESYKGTSMMKRLRYYGLYGKKSEGKFIPKEYLLSSVEDRLELLQGLMDTDGFADASHLEFTTVSKELAEDMRFLCGSLGIRTRTTIKKTSYKNKNGEKVKGQNTYRISLYTDKPVFKLQRKLKFINGNSSKIHKTSITKIEKVGTKETYCIEVDSEDHLFLTDNFTVTHNSGGKSFWVALGELEYNFVFGGARRYDKDFVNNELSARQLVGSTDKTKSSELLDKFKKSQDAKIENKNERYVKWFGTYTEIYYDEKGKQREKVTPCPFYKKTTGNLECPNKENPYKAEYRVDINGEWKKKGTGSELVHVNYSTKKGDGAQAGVGGRYLFSDVEEIGLVQNYTDIWTSNKSATRRNGLKFGVQWAQGTSGNIEFVQEAKKVFLNPQDYDCLTFTNIFSSSGQDGKIGYFIPNYIVQFDCKDENGNTDYDKALGKVNKGRFEASKSKDTKVLRDHLMNEPCFVDEMWLTDQGYYLPYEEAAIREKQLMQYDTYRTLEKCVKLVWDSTKSRGVDYHILHDGEPYREFPIVGSKRKNPQGCIVIYEFPQEINGQVPPDMYRFIGLDPYVEQDITRGGSVGSLYIIMNPKYIPHGYNGNTIVASYNDKPLAGLDEYYENVEKLLAFYGNPLQGLNYEKNRGESCRAHFIKKSKLHLLNPTPQREMGTNIYQRNITSFGYVVGNKIVKINLLKMVRDWLLEETTLSDGTKKNIERIPCLYLVRQIMQYDIDENFDAVDGLRGAILALKEYENLMQSEAKVKERTSNDFKGYLNNGKIFNKKQYGTKRFSKT